MKINEIITESYQPPELEVGDKILKGKFKNSPAEIKGFKKDKHNQPVLKTNKGDVQLFKPRIAKLDVNENSLNEFAPGGDFKPPAPPKKKGDDPWGNDRRSQIGQAVKQLLAAGNKVDWKVPGQMGHVVSVTDDGVTMKRWGMPRSKMRFFLYLSDDRDDQYQILMVRPGYYKVVGSDPKWNLKEQGVAEGSPDFDREWDEATRYPEFVKLGKEKWIELVSKGKPVTVTRKNVNKINNTDAADPKSFKLLDPEKQKRALAQLATGDVEMPIIARYSDGYLELIGGNTRLTAQMAKDGQAKVWLFNVPEELTQNATEGSLNEFAPGNGDDGLPYAEFVVYQCDPTDKWEFMGRPLYQTDNLGMAHKFAYEMYVKYRPKAFIIYQPHAEASRGHYGVKGESDGTEVNESVAEGSLNEFAITPDDGPGDGKQAGRWLVTYMVKNGITKEKIMVGKNANAVAKYFEFKYRRKPLSVVPYFDDIDLRGSLGLDEAKKRKAKRRSSYKGYYGAWGFGDSGGGEGGE